MQKKKYVLMKAKNPDVACPEVFDPVLGCDEQIYSNSCEAEKNGVRFWTEIDIIKKATKL